MSHKHKTILSVRNVLLKCFLLCFSVFHARYICVLLYSWIGEWQKRFIRFLRSIFFRQNTARISDWLTRRNFSFEKCFLFKKFRLCSKIFTHTFSGSPPCSAIGGSAEAVFAAVLTKVVIFIDKFVLSVSTAALVAPQRPKENIFAFLEPSSYLTTRSRTRGLGARNLRSNIQNREHKN